jgi:hypothetical protein
VFGIERFRCVADGAGLDVADGQDPEVIEQRFDEAGIFPGVEIFERRLGERQDVLDAKAMTPPFPLFALRLPFLCTGFVRSACAFVYASRAGDNRAAYPPGAASSVEAEHFSFSRSVA